MRFILSLLPQINQLDITNVTLILYVIRDLIIAGLALT